MIELGHRLFDTAILQHFPPDYVEQCGTPVLVHDGHELMELIGW